MAPKRSIADITEQQEAEGASVTGMQEPKPRKIETDIDGPIVPDYLEVDDGKKRKRRVPRVLQNMTYAVIVLLLSWTLWEWWLTRQAEDTLDSARESSSSKKSVTDMQGVARSR